jgi:hypothetical protein
MNSAEMESRDMSTRRSADPAPPASANITPSKQIIFTALGILVPVLLLFVALFSGTIQP